MKKTIIIATILLGGCAATISQTTTTHTINPSASSPFANVMLTDNQLPSDYMPGTGRVDAITTWTNRLKATNYLSVYEGGSGSQDGVPYVDDFSRNQSTRLYVNKDWIVCKLVTTIPNEFSEWVQRGEMYYSGNMEATITPSGIQYTHKDYQCKEN